VIVTCVFLGEEGESPAQKRKGANLRPMGVVVDWNTRAIKRAGVKNISGEHKEGG